MRTIPHLTTLASFMLLSTAWLSTAWLATAPAVADEPPPRPSTIPA